jgi:DNA-binding NtrC family response regulator
VSRRGSVLIVDDESYVRDSLATVLERHGFAIRTAASAEEVYAEHELEGLDALVTDLKMDGADGLELLKRVRETESKLPVIVLTGHGTVGSAVECMRAGAAEYLLKPVQPEEMILILERVIESSAARRELDYLRRGAGSADSGRGPIGRSPAWKEILDLVEVVAPNDTPVLLTGESGTGKEEVARLIHRRGRRSAAPLVAVNCAAIPGELFESELFGHRKGSFTGATADREGRFRVAHRGTLLLDEIDAFPVTAQAKLLRVIQEGEFERVGDSRPTAVDVRLICASNSDLSEAVESGAFRADLFYRINVMTIRVPPLRERVEDIALLAEAFLEDANARLGRHVEGLEAETRAALEAYSWPGNVRELRNVIERGVLLERDPILRPRSLPPELVRSAAESGAPVVRDAADPEDLNLQASLAREERRLLETALERADGVKRAAAKMLGVDERNLAYYLRKHDLMK